jgi:ABC-2 type transport system permease protein
MTARASALRAFIVKELRHILRDRQTLIILLTMPLAQVVLFGFALRSDVRNVKVGVVDPAPDFATAAVKKRFAGNGRFRIVGDAPSLGALDRAFRRNNLDIAVVFEPGFASRLASGAPAQVLLVTDASDPNSSATRQAYASAVIAAYQKEIGTPPGLVKITPRVRMRFNPTLESTNLFVPGLIALVLTLVAAIMTAISLSREKERGTLEVLLVSPLKPWQIIAGKVLPYLLLAFANVVTAVVAARLIFDVPLRGSLTLLLFASILYSMVGLALGTLIASLTTSQRAAMLGAVAGTMLPNTLLSGMVFPIASLPAWLQPVTYIVPARWFIIIARGIMLKGTGMTYLWREHLILVLMLTVLLIAAVRSFKPRMG